MKKLTILDEEFMVSETESASVLNASRKVIQDIVQFSNDINCSDLEDIRFCPSYLEKKNQIQPVDSVQKILAAIQKAIVEKKNVFNFFESGIISSIYNYLMKVDTKEMSAFEEIISIFGSEENVYLDLVNKNITVSETGLAIFRNKLSDLRIKASNSLGELNSAVNSNNIEGVLKSLREICLLKELAQHIV